MHRVQAASAIVVVAIVNVVSIIIVIVIAAVAATAAAAPAARLFFHVVIIVCGTLHICPCGTCVHRAAWGGICIIMRVLLKLQLQRKSHCNIMQHGSMQHGEEIITQRQPQPEGVLFILVSWKTARTN